MQEDAITVIVRLLKQLDVEAEQLAMFVDENWKELTGLPDNEKRREGEFPQTVLDIVEKTGFDYEEFCDAWTTLHS